MLEKRRSRLPCDPRGSNAWWTRFKRDDIINLSPLGKNTGEPFAKNITRTARRQLDGRHQLKENIFGAEQPSSPKLAD